jgi:succinate dehydrogenase / fumarate reductase cytochrome b subunit
MRERPLSPHLGIYRFSFTMALSILHRLTGVILSVGLILLAYWLTSVAAGPAAYERASAVFGNWFVRLLIAGWICAFAYHLSNGLRHLWWDTGHGFEKTQVRASGRVAVVVAVVVALVILWTAFSGHGGAP